MGVVVLCGLTQLGQQIGPVKRFRRKCRRKLQHLKQKTEYFNLVRDAVEKEKIKQLLQGNMPRIECKAWLERAEEIVHQVNDILKSEGKSSDSVVFFVMKVREPLMTMLDEIADQLEKCIELGLLIDDHQKIKKGTSIPKYQEEKYSPKKIEPVSLRRNMGTKTKPEVVSEMPFKVEKEDAHREEVLQKTSTHTSEYTNKYDTGAAKVVTVQSPSSEEETVPVAEVKGNMVLNKIDESETRSDILHFSYNSYSVSNLHSPASSVAEAENEISYLPGTKTKPMPEASIEHIPAATEDLFSVEEPEIVEIHTDSVVGMTSSSGREIKTILSENEEEHQMKPEFRIDIKKSVQPFVPVAKPGLFSSKKRENPGDSVSSTPVTNGKRSIYHSVQKILGCLRNGTARRIGIYGCGGIGKTTVLKELLTHTEVQNMFDSIIWVNVSRFSNTRKIQKQVVEQLFNCQAGFDTDTEAILHALESKKVLLLLDDVLERIDLDAVDISNPNQETGCRIIMTTRSLDVCQIMAVDTTFELEVLTMKEAWELFHDQVGGIINSPDIEPYARAIVAACGGLPLTIVVTGRALREENTVSMWQHALMEFLSFSSFSKPGNEAVVQQLKFSYNKLKARDVKDCFLYCALIQEDQVVNISELIKYFSKEGLVSRNLADSYEKGLNTIKILLSASLLESANDGLSVKMHDVVRDLASAIMSPEEEGCQFLVRTDLRLIQEPESPNSGVVESEYESAIRPISEGPHLLLGAGAGLTQLPSNEKWQQAKMIFLMDNDLSCLPDIPSYPKLLALFLQRNNQLRAIPMSFFDGIPHLQILNLSKTRINSLSPSLFKLKKLKALLLRDCERFSILPPEIGALEHLELLDLRDTYIYNLPSEIGKLTCLRHLLVSFYGTNYSSEFAKLPHILISDGIISRFHQLNELSIDVYPGDHRWSRSVETVTAEVLNLKQLKNLSFYFPEVKLLELYIQESHAWKSGGLTKFRFIVGHNVKRIVARVPHDVEFAYNQQYRCLRFVNGETVPSVVKEVLTCTKAFYLDHHLNIQSLSEFGVSNINTLELCIVRECHEIKTVMDGNVVEDSTLPIFSLLEDLIIHYLWNLMTIWVGPIPTGSLSKLRFLSIHTCPQLPFVLASSMLQNLYNLEVLVVEDCQAVKDVIFKDSNIGSGDIVLPKLRKLKLHYLPNLISIWKGPWPSVERVSFYNCPNLKSLHMDFNLTSSLKEIRAEKMWWDELDWEDTSLYLQLQDYFSEVCYEDL